MSDYRVPKVTAVQGLSIIKSEATSRLYGIGIGKALFQQEANSSNTTDYETTGDYDPDQPDAIPNSNGGYNKSLGYDGYISSSLVGMPVMCYLKMIGGTYRGMRGEIVEVPDIVFETVVVTLTLNKNIEITEIAGRNSGSVKEMIGMGDWDIEIRAIITADAPVNESVQRRNQSGVYPRANMEQIYKMLIAPIAIPVDCWYLNQFGINYIVVDQGTQIQQIEGEYSMQRLVIPAISDNPLIIRLANA